MLRNAPNLDVRLIVVTDNERILGLGDQGAGGMGIPVGKLALYTAAAGIHPALCLPISLDVGTDNVELLADPYYRGYRQRRLRGEPYEEFIEAFVDGVRRSSRTRCCSGKTFTRTPPLMLLDRYRKRFPSFNDDIQGTAAVTLAGILSASADHRQGGSPTSESSISGPGRPASASLGWSSPAWPRRVPMRPRLRRAQAMLDSQGLVFNRRDEPRSVQERILLDAATTLNHYGFEGDGPVRLLEVVTRVKPTVLIGTTGNPGVFSEAVIREMARHVGPAGHPAPEQSHLEDRVQPLRGPALDRRPGHRGHGQSRSPRSSSTASVRHIGQANNVYIFPGIGLGAILAETREVSESMFLIAAEALAACVSEDDLADGRIYPDQSQLRRVARAIAAGRHPRGAPAEPGPDDPRPGHRFDAGRASSGIPDYDEVD